MTQDTLQHQIDALAPWFHNLRLGGVQTAPGHFLGDYPAVKWAHLGPALSADMSGRTVLDIGCNAGFYALEMKRRGAARVLGIDSDEHYLRQARFAAEVEGLEVAFERLDIWDVGALGERFDLVIFMGVLYHLRHPLLALDLVREHVAGDMMLFQTMRRGSTDVAQLATDYEFTDTAVFNEPGYPKMHFVEHSYSHDPTNWWAPNRACTEAMLRASGFRIVAQPEDETYLCQVAELPVSFAGPNVVYPARGAA